MAKVYYICHLLRIITQDTPYSLFTKKKKKNPKLMVISSYLFVVD